MTSEGDEPTQGAGRAMPCRPPFPVFPFVFPLMFPIGLAAILIAMGRRRRGGLAARVASLEEKVEHLTAEGRR